MSPDGIGSQDARTGGGEHAVVLRDDASGAEARIAPGLGFRLFDLRLPVAGVPVVWPPDGGPAHAGPSTRQGVPVLSPFPNRIRAGRFRFAGRGYRLP